MRLLDELRFEFWKLRDRFAHLFGGKGHVQGVFSRIHEDNSWGDRESKSGSGSSLDGSESLRRQLPSLLSELGVRVFLDAPCGDFHWMSQVVGSLDRYIGVDIVEELITENRALYETDSVRFLCADICSASLPKCDMILCRDCCIHLPTRLISALLQNFKESGAEYLLLSNDADSEEYHDIPIGSFRKINFMKPPFSFPAPSRTLLEDERGDRQVCLWRIADLPI